MKKIIVLLLLSLILIGCSTSKSTEKVVKSNTAEPTDIQKEISTPMPSPTAKQKTIEPTLPPTDQPMEDDTPLTDVVKVVDTYNFQDRVVFAVENKGETTVSGNISVTFYKKGKTVSVQEASEEAINAGGITLIDLFVDDKYDKFEWTEEYVDSLYGDLSLSDISYKKKAVKKDKVILDIKNNSENSISFLQAKVVFFNKMKPVSVEDNYCIDIDDELKAGAKKSVEIEAGYDSKYNNVKFDDFKVYFSGRVTE